MEKDAFLIGHICCPRVYHWDAKHVSADVVDGMDYVESCDGDLSWGSRLSGAYTACANLAGKEVLSECLEIYQARISYHVRGTLHPCCIYFANTKIGMFWLFLEHPLLSVTLSLPCSSPCSHPTRTTALKPSLTLPPC